MGLFQSLIEPENLRRIAGEASFKRGSRYAKTGRVKRLARGEDRIEARVEGTDSYRVEIRVADDGLFAVCDCPVGERGAFCKHCVAVGLVAGESDPADTEPLAADRLRDYLGSLPREKLVELLLEEAEADDVLFDRLSLRAEIHSGTLDLATVGQTIKREVKPGGFVSYHEAREYAQSLNQALGLLDLVGNGADPVELVKLIERCSRWIESAAGKVDDSDGFLGFAFARIQRQHRAACERAGFAPEVLAERLFKLMKKTDYELFYDSVDEYGELLGEAGVKRYAQLVSIEWERLPVVGPGDDWPDRFSDFRIKYVMELLARRSGDVDELIAVWSRDLSLPYTYLQIGEALMEAGRHGEAIDWAERGLAAFPDRRDPRLVRFFAGVLMEWGEQDRALDLMRGEFEQHAGKESYAALKPFAEAVGRWPEERRKALDLLTAQIEEIKTSDRRTGMSRSAHPADELVRIYLWEADLQVALQAAKQDGCVASTWRELAERLEDSDPGEATAIYRDQVEFTIDRKTKGGYRYAAKEIIKIRDLMDRAGQAEEFPAFIEQIRETHRRKRTFMKILGDAGV